MKLPNTRGSWAQLLKAQAPSSIGSGGDAKEMSDFNQVPYSVCRPATRQVAGTALVCAPGSEFLLPCEYLGSLEGVWVLTVLIATALLGWRASDHGPAQQSNADPPRLS